MNSTLGRSPAVKCPGKVECTGVWSNSQTQIAPSFSQHVFAPVFRALSGALLPPIRPQIWKILAICGKPAHEEFNRTGTWCGILAAHTLKLPHLANARNLTADFRGLPWTFSAYDAQNRPTFEFPTLGTSARMFFRPGLCRIWSKLWRMPKQQSPQCSSRRATNSRRFDATYFSVLSVGANMFICVLERALVAAFQKHMR